MTVSLTRSQWHHDKRYLSKRRNGYLKDLQSLSQTGEDFLELREIYKDPSISSSIKIRYGNWQANRLLQRGPYYNDPYGPGSTNQTKRMLLQSRFLGITEHFQISMCLFYWTLERHHDFNMCKKRENRAFNAACYHGGITNGDCGSSDFADKSHVDSALLRAEAHRIASTISPELSKLISANTRTDMELYAYALDIFWRRIATMVDITGLSAPELPEEYRNH